jgi:hypothetical protein
MTDRSLDAPTVHLVADHGAREKAVAGFSDHVFYLRTFFSVHFDDWERFGA